MSSRSHRRSRGYAPYGGAKLSKRERAQRERNTGQRPFRLSAREQQRLLGDLLALADEALAHNRRRVGQLHAWCVEHGVLSGAEALTRLFTDWQETCQHYRQLIESQLIASDAVYNRAVGFAGQHLYRLLLTRRFVLFPQLVRCAYCPVVTQVGVLQQASASDAEARRVLLPLCCAHSGLSDMLLSTYPVVPAQQNPHPTFTQRWVGPGRLAWLSGNSPISSLVMQIPQGSLVMQIPQGVTQPGVTKSVAPQLYMQASSANSIVQLNAILDELPPLSSGSSGSSSASSSS